MTSRQFVTSGVAAALGLSAAVAAGFGQSDAALAILGLLLACLIVLLIDVRRRQGDMARRLKQMSQRQRIDSHRISRLGTIPQEVKVAMRASMASAANATEVALGRMEAAGEGLLAGLAQERLATAERHAGIVRLIDEVSSALAEVKDDVAARFAETEQGDRRRQVALREHLGRLEYEPVRQVQALLQLIDRFEPRAPLPPTGGWAVEPSTLLQLMHLVESSRPALIVECGSGTSTLWLAYALEALGGTGRVVAIEHDERFAEQTRLLLDEHGLGGIAEVRLAPLSEIEIGGKTYAWYDRNAVKDLDGIGLLLVDGPPRTSGPQARYPAMPVLVTKLAPGAQIILDDVDRAAEQEAVEAWLSENPGLVRQHNGIDRSASFVYRPA